MIKYFLAYTSSLSFCLSYKKIMLILLDSGGSESKERHSKVCKKPHYAKEDGKEKQNLLLHQRSCFCCANGVQRNASLKEKST